MRPDISQTIYSLLITAIAALPLAKVNAQIVPDNSLGAESSRIQAINAAFDRIEGGAQRGSSLFHSFQEFSIFDGHSAYFANPAAISTIFSRVTGENISNILGTLGVDGPANLVFINPNGVVFGPNARLDIPGSFFVTTANQVQFPDGSVFSAVNPAAPPLLTIDVPVPVGLVFAGDKSGRIYNQADLAVGGDLSFQGGEIVSAGSLTARTGQINLTTEGTTSGDIVITGLGDRPSLLANTATLSASNDLILTETAIGTQGDLTLTAENTVMMRDSVTKPLQVVAGQDLGITGKQGVDIFALNHPQSGLVSGRDMVLSALNAVGGDAHFWSGGSFRIEDLTGALGNLESPYDPVIRSQGDVRFYAYQGASLHIIAGGSVEIDTVIVDGPDTIGDSINPTATPELANVTLSNGELITINGNAQPTVDIRAGVNPDKIGTPLGTTGLNGKFFDQFINIIPPPANNPLPPSRADITISDIWIAADAGLALLTNQYEPNLNLAGGDILIPETGFFGDGIYTARSTGASGDVILDSRGKITLNSEINTTSRSSDSGDVTLLAQDDILINRAIRTFTAGFALGNGGDVLIQGGGNIILDGLDSQINSNLGSFSTGNGGNIMIAAGESLTLDNGASISARTSAGNSGMGEGNAGNINLTANQIELDNTSFIATASNGLGDSGNITLTANNAILLNNGRINSDLGRFSTGNGGNITIAAGESLTLDNGASISAQTSAGRLDLGEGNAGNIKITANQINLDNGSFLATASNGLGDSGDISLTATDAIFLDNDSSITSYLLRNGIGDAGNIEIKTGSLTATNNSYFDSSSFGEGNGGNVIIEATGSVSFNEGSFTGISSVFSPTSVTSEDSFNAGNITITAQSLVISSGAKLDTSHSGDLGNAGNIEITVNDQLRFSGSNSGAFTNLGTPTASGSGQAGNITIEAGSVIVEDNALLESNLVGEGIAGNIDVRANQNIIFDNGRVNTSVNGSGQGGNILVAATDSIQSQATLFNASLTGTGIGGVIQLQSGGDTTLDSTFLFNGVNAASIGESQAITLTANNLTLQNQTLINSSTSGEGRAGDITINATGDVLIANDSIISSGNRQATAIGDGGDITVNANNLTLDQSGSITTDTFGQGDAGRITLDVTQAIALENTSAILATVNEGSTGNSQSIDIRAQRINIGDRSIIATRTETNGNAGSIRISATESLSLQDGGISSDVDGGAGSGGDIEIFVPNLSLDLNSSIQSITAGQGDAGNVKIDADTVILNNLSAILANTINAGNAGNIEIIARESLSQNASEIQTSASIDTINNIIPTGDSGAIQITSPTINLTNNSGIFSFTEGGGKAGNIQIFDNQQLSLDQSFISAAINPTGNSPQPSNIVLDTQQLNLQNESVISTSTEGIGDAGNITVPDAETITLNNSQMTASTNTDSDAGAITLTAKQAIILDQNSQLTTETSGAGNASDINLTAPRLSVNNGSRISAKTSNAGNSGTVNVIAVDQVQLGQNSNLTVETAGSGAPGDINLTTETLTLGDNAQLSATATATATNTEGGGRINLNANTLNIAGQLGIFAETNSVTPAGNLTITPYTSADLAINFRNNGFISASTTSAGDGGNITVQAPNTLQLDGQGKVSVTTSGSGNAGTIAMEAQDVILENGVEISASTTGSGNAGNITLRGDRLGLNQSQVSAFTAGSGNAGQILLTGKTAAQAQQITLQNNSQLSTTIQPTGVSDQPSNIRLETDQLTLQTQSVISTSTEGIGNAGNITVPDAETITLNNAQMTASTNTDSDAGAITLTAKQSINLDQNSQLSAETSGAGNASDINLTAPRLSVNNGSRISAKTTDAGNSGTVNVIAVDQVQLGQNSNLTVETAGSGAPGDINLTTETLTLGDNAQLSATATATATNTEGGGSINLNANTLNIAGQLGIFAETNSVTPAGNLVITPYTSANLAINFRNNGFISASTTSAGDGGNITVQAPNNLTLDGQGKVSVTTSGSGNAGTIAMDAQDVILKNGVEISASTTGAGQGGQITVNGDRLDIQSGSQIRTSTSSAGQAGSINIQLTDALTINGPDSGIFADGEPQATGDSGNIFIDPPLVSLTNGAQISANNQGSGVGGNITLFAGDLVLDNAGIFAQTASNQGGNITLAIADQLIFLGNGQISTTAGTAQAGGDGGNITIQANQIFGDLYGNNQISANAFTGNGGNINIAANYLFGFAVGDAPFPTSTITASSDFGFDGNIILDIPDLNPLRGVDRLPEQTVNVTLQRGCEAGRSQGQAAFYEIGKGGIPRSLPTFFDGTPSPTFTPIPLDDFQSNPAPPSAQSLSLLPFRLTCQQP